MMRLNLYIKRIFDIVSSFIAIILLLPVWIGVTIAIKKDSPGPVFFRQERRTKDGKVFQMLKFRSMVVNAEIWGRIINYQNDPRVTKWEENSEILVWMNFHNSLIFYLDQCQ